jgi:DHA2 family multidrug resistance protein
MPANKSNSVSALMNLGRNMGGSCGIALLSTLLSHRTQFHINTLGYYTNQYNSNFVDSLNRIAQTFTDRGATAAVALLQAKQVIWGQILKQASMLSFIDAFYVLMWLVICAVPLAFLLKPNKGAQAAGGH